MSNIRVLPPLLVNQIAAGECIERPASVVKELVENSIDAHAENIEVHIEEAGVRLIRVIDDGEGIIQDDLPLALTSHATSKVATTEDLFSIGTLGFRGEALASIASVSEVKVSSSTDKTGGYSVVSRQGQLDAVKPVGMPKGTIVEVHDLFFNVPARRKFLKKRSVEMGHITDALTRLALSQPQISFKLMHNDRLVFAVDKADHPKIRVEELLGIGNIPLLTAENDNARCKLVAYIAAPEATRPNTKLQYLYINSRSIRDKVAMRAFADAYQDYVPQRRHPIGVIYLEIDPEEVDVNVHPAKTEVRYRDSSLIYSTIRNSIVRALSAANLSPEIPVDFPEQVIQPKPPAKKQGNTDDLFRVHERVSPYQPGSDPGPEKDIPLVGNTDRAEKIREFTRRDAVEKQQTESFPSAYPDTTEPLGNSTNFTRAHPETAPLEAREEMHRTSSLSSSAEGREEMRYFQVHDSYLVVETAEGVEIIDQHALHERIVYSRLRKQIQERKVISQGLLFPVTIKLTGKEMATFQQWHKNLAEVGIEAEICGANAVVVRSMPQLLGNVCEAELLHDLLAQLGEKAEISLEDILDPVLAMMACKASVKAGDRLNPQEIQSLLRRRAEADNPFHCPHGRPTTLKLTLLQLEKHFKRR